MKTNSSAGMLPARRRVRFPRTLGVVAMALAVIVLYTGCSSQPGGEKPASAPASNVTLTATQQQHIRLYTVARSDYRKTVQTTGTVDFDNDRATSVLAPFSGPVSRLLVSSGDKVRKGQPLAVVDSPDFAAAISTYSKGNINPIIYYE